MPRERHLQAEIDFNEHGQTFNNITHPVSSIFDCADDDVEGLLRGDALVADFDKFVKEMQQ